MAHRMLPGIPGALLVIRVEGLVPTMAVAFLQGKPSVFDPLPVEIDIASIRLADPDDLRHRLRHVAKVAGAFRQHARPLADPLLERFVLLADRFFGLALAGDVAKHQHHPMQRPVAIVNRRGAVGDRYFAAVARDEDGMVGEFLDFAGGECRGNRNDCRQAGLLVHDAEDVVDRQAPCLVEAPPGHPLRDTVHADHAPAGVGGDDRVADRHQGDRQALLAERQGFPAGLGEPDLAPDEKIGHGERRGHGDDPAARGVLFGGALLQEAPLLVRHLANNAGDPLAGLRQRYRLDIPVGRLPALGLDDFLDAPRDGDALVDRFLQACHAFLLFRVVGGQFAQVGEAGRARPLLHRARAGVPGRRSTGNSAC